MDRYVAQKDPGAHKFRFWRAQVAGSTQKEFAGTRYLCHTACARAAGRSKCIKCTYLVCKTCVYERPFRRCIQVCRQCYSSTIDDSLIYPLITSACAGCLLDDS